MTMGDETDQILLDRADVEYFLSAFKNAKDHVLLDDLKTQIKNLSPGLTKSKLTKMLEQCVLRLEELLGENNDI